VRQASQEIEVCGNDPTTRGSSSAVEIETVDQIKDLLS